MPTDRSVEGVKAYHHPAGGWGALRATAKAVREQMDLSEVGVLMRTNKPTGFDCPGCAWPDKEHTSAFQFCENGAKAVTWEATKKRATPAFFAAHTVSELWGWTDHALEDEGRLTHPLAYDAASDRFAEVTWDEAFARIGAVLRALPDPNMAEFYTSGRTSNEAAFLYQLFAREFGTNNFPDCSNMCHEATSVGLPQSIGIGKGTVSLDDFDHAELIISMGHNPGTNHPRMMGTLHDAARRGCRIIVFNPLRERALERFADPQSTKDMATFTSEQIADEYYQVKVGGDAAALKGIMKALIALDDAAPGAIDHAFIATHTNGYAALEADLRATEWADIEAASGLRQADLEEVAAVYAASNATIIPYGMGITQHATGTQTVQQIANLLLMRGNFGKPGAGICPLRGHSNVQGDRTVGITEKPSAAMLGKIEALFGFTPPTAHGHDAVAAMKAIVDGRSTVLVAMGGNLAVALPDPVACFAGMRRLELAVHVATKLNRSHLLIGKNAIILPCLGRTERDMQATGPQAVTVEDSMSMVHASQGRLPPASPELRSEIAIVAGMARATLPHAKVDYATLAGDYALIRDGIEGVFSGFENYNERIGHPGGFRLPLGPTERKWHTPSGRAEFHVFAGLEEDIARSAPDVFRLTTVRSHDQYNTTIYGMDDRYRGVFGRRDVVFMNKDDLAERGLAHGDRITLKTAFDQGVQAQLQGFTVIAHDIARGSLAAYYPEANGLIPLGYGDEQSGTPSYKSVPVRITLA